MKEKIIINKLGNFNLSKAFSKTENFKLAVKTVMQRTLKYDFTSTFRSITSPLYVTVSLSVPKEYAPATFPSLTNGIKIAIIMTNGMTTEDLARINDTGILDNITSMDRKIP